MQIAIQIIGMIVLVALSFVAGRMTGRQNANQCHYQTFDLEAIEAKLFETPRGPRIKMVDINIEDDYDE